jgi:hypothetical protein
MWVMVISWLCSIAYKGVAIHANQRDILDFRSVMLVSAIANTASFGSIGLFILSLFLTHQAG